MWPFKKRENRAEMNPSDETSVDAFLSAFLSGVTITREKAMQIPAVSGCINKLSGTITRLPIKLYRRNTDGTVQEIQDNRLRLLNDDTGDTLNANEFWKAMLRDYYFGSSGATAYINREHGEYKSLHYIDSRRISTLVNNDAIYKDYCIFIDGQRFYPYEFLKLKRETTDGVTNIPLQNESSKALQVAYARLVFEEILLTKGGNKKGFFEAQSTLSDDAVTALRTALHNLYSTNDKSENFAILNSGIKFHESSSSPQEMQLNENKESDTKEICKLFSFPHTIIDGGATEEDIKAYNSAVTDLLTVIETALDRDLLLENEKGTYYFAFDTRELTRGNIKERYEAYATGLKNRFLQVDDVRKEEDFKPLGFNFIPLGLGDVLYNPETKEVYTPNTNQFATLGGTEQRANPNHDEKGKFAEGENSAIDKNSKSGIIKSSEHEKDMNYITESQEYTKAIHGLVVHDGTNVKNVSCHAARRMIERNVSIEQLADILINANITYPSVKHNNAKIFRKGNVAVSFSKKGEVITVIKVGDD